MCIRDSLFRHVNGAWLDSASIPADQGAYGSFQELRDASELAVRRLCESAAAGMAGASGPIRAGHDEDGARQRIGALYASFMDEDRVEARGLEPILTGLAAIESVADLEEFMELSGSLQQEGVGGLVQTGALNDVGSPDRMLLHLLQDGLGLPDESYYREEKFAQILSAYRRHVARMFSLAGIGGDSGETRADADRVVDLSLIHI